jgi:hypothetical protein
LLLLLVKELPVLGVLGGVLSSLIEMLVELIVVIILTMTADELRGRLPGLVVLLGEARVFTWGVVVWDETAILLTVDVAGLMVRGKTLPGTAASNVEDRGLRIGSVAGCGRASTVKAVVHNVFLILS